MRTRTMTLIAALLVASASDAQAQDAKPARGTAAEAGRVELHAAVRQSDRLRLPRHVFHGVDEARYHRYRDLRDGGDVDRFRFAKETTTHRVPRRGQQRRLPRPALLRRSYNNTARSGRPSSSTRTRSTSQATQPLTRRRHRHADDQRRRPDRDPDKPADAESALAAYGNQLQHREPARRRQLQHGLHARRRDVDVKVQVRNTNRSGSNLQDFGFGSSPGNRWCSTCRCRSTTGPPTWAPGSSGPTSAASRGRLRRVVSSSTTSAFTFDNPQRVTDSATAGPAFGRAALMPNNSMNTFNVSGAYQAARPHRRRPRRSATARWTRTRRCCR